MNRSQDFGAKTDCSSKLVPRALETEEEYHNKTKLGP